MIWVSATRLHLKSWFFLPAFGLHAARAERQARSADGNLHVGTTRDRRGGFWTVTLWRDEGAMRAFMGSGAHLKAMPGLMRWCDEGAIAHWLQEAPTVPSWSEVSARMKSEGRRPKLHRPSERHDRFDIPLLP